MDGIGRLVGPVLLSLMAGTIASGCKQPVVIPSPGRRLGEIADRVHLLGPRFSVSTTNLLTCLGLENLAHRDLRAAFSTLEQKLQYEQPGQTLLLAMAELAAEISTLAALTSQEAIAWSRDAALLSAFCLSISQQPPFDESIWPTGCFIHNQSVTRCLRLAGTDRVASRNDWPERLRAVGIHLGSPVPAWTTLGFDRLEPADQLTVTGITPMGYQPGLGVPLVAHRFLDDAQKAAWKQYGPDAAVFVATAIIQPPLSLANWRSVPAELTLLDPTSTDTVRFGASSFPMAIDRTTPLVRRLSQPSLQNYEYLGVLDPEFYNAQAGAYAVDPYQPGKVPVVFIHGLWSSPKVWVPMLDALRADPVIRAHFQFWVVLYPSGYPLPIAAQSIRKSLREIRQRFDPSGSDPALSRIVIVGKSTGGQATRMLVESSGPDLWNAVFTRPFQELQIPSTLKVDLASAFFYEPEPYIRTAVFITTAHRGGNLARQPAAQLGVSLIRQNNPLRAAWDDLQAANHPDSIQPLFRKHSPTSLDGMRAGNPLLLAIDARPIAPTVTYHSIIASLHPGLPRDAMTDGFVRYTSAHLEGAASEQIVTSSHLCEANPEVITEVRRILLAQPNSPPNTYLSADDHANSLTRIPDDANIFPASSPIALHPH
jgi:pimeloyl-ACP methyl ester carboxylesterase